jgi:hypothetical protein
VTAIGKKEVVARGARGVAWGLELDGADASVEALCPKGGLHLVAEGIRAQHHLVSEGARSRSEGVRPCEVLLTRLKG